MAALGNVNCLSGTVVYVRLDALLAVIKHRSSQNASLHEYWKERFGDDRYLTQRLIERFGARSTDIQTDIVSHTQAAIPFTTLIEQRRRWLLGTVATEAAALCNAKFWADCRSQCLYRLYSYAGVETDVRALLMLLVASHLHGGARSFVVAAVLTLLGLNAATLRSFPSVRQHLSISVYFWSLLLLPLMNMSTRLYVVGSLWERGWGSTRKG